MQFFSWRVCWFVATVLMLGLPVQAAPEQGLLFYLPFEQGAQAEVAGGNPAPLSESKPGDLVPGIKGKGVLLNERTLLAYAIPGNYNNARGALEFCFQYGKPIAVKGLTYLFFEEGRTNANAIFAQRLSEGDAFNRIVWNLDTGTYRMFRLAILNPKWLGEWHHCLLTWDKDKDTDLYLDGQMVMYGKRYRGDNFSEIPTTRGAVSNTVMTFGPRNCAKFPKETQDVAVVMDEIKIYDRRLTSEEAAACYRAYFPLDLTIRGRVFEVDQAKTTRVELKNQTRAAVVVTSRWDITDAEGLAVLQRGEGGTVTIPANGRATLDIPVLLKAPGEYLLRLTCAGTTVFSKNFRICACPIERSGQAVAEPKLALKPVKEFDCAREYGAEEFCDDGLSKVVDSPLGKYRVTSAAKPWSRFAYRFFVAKPQTPHLAVVEYPDDHEYEMEVMIDNRSNQLYQTVENGVMVGGCYPNSNTLKRFELLFWPADRECTIMIMGWPIGVEDRYKDEQISMAAAKSIKIYEVTGDLPAVKLANLPPANRQRSVGTREEDATSTREFGGNLVNQCNGFEEIYRMLNRRVRYMNWLGQNLYSMTFIHYAGGFYTSDVMPKDVPRQAMYPDYWIELALYLCEKNGIKVNAGLHLRQDEALKAMANQSEDDIIAGQDTIFNIKCDGSSFGKGALFAGPPDYNVLHPKVQKHILDTLDDLLVQYCDSPAFNGFDFWFWSTMLFWFGDLRSGYDDYTVALFQQETGMKVPGAAPDPTRFTQRYLFLAQNDPAVREKWIEWRCRKVHEFWLAIQDRVQRKNPRLIINLECWAVLAVNFINVNNAAVIWKPGDSNCFYNYYREGGLDLNGLKGRPNFYLGNVVYPNYNPVLDYALFRDFVFAPEFSASFENQGLNSVWLQQFRREFDCMQNAMPMPGYWLPEGVGAKIGNQPPRRQGSQERGTAFAYLEKSGAVMPQGDFYLEPYAKALADWDVRQITDGGLTTTTLGAESALREFIRAYRTLPVEYFEVFQGVDDPVCLRHRLSADGYYFYLVNREFYPATVTLTFAKRPPAAGGAPVLLDLAANAPVSLRAATNGYTAELEVGPYRLRSFRLPAATSLIGAQVRIPPERSVWLKQRFDTLTNELAVVEARHLIPPKLVATNLPWFKAALETAWTTKRYAYLRKLLDSYWGRYVHRLCAEKNDKLAGFLQADKYTDGYFNRPTRTYRARKVAAIPALDSAEWKKTEPIEDFGQVLLYKPQKEFLAKPSREKTAVYCLYDEKEIALLFECFDANIAAVVPQLRRGETDLIKIMLSPEKAGRPYFYYRIHYDNANAYTAQCALEGSATARADQLKYEAQFKKEKDRWLARIVIPFADLELKSAPVKGAVWRLNLVRQIRAEETDALRCVRVYDPPQPWGFHDPQTFDRLQFE